MFRWFRRCRTAAAALMVLSAPAAAQDAGFTLPRGCLLLAGDISGLESRLPGDAQGGLCGLAAADATERQRLLAIELGKGADGGVSGNLVLPFGLLLDAGATLRVDDGQPRAPLRFVTCLPGGCLVPLGSGTALKIKVQSIDKKELALSVSLKGLAAALDRLKALAGA